MTQTCPRCQAAIDAEARVCPDCGAPLAPGAHAEMPPDAHRDLARANLMRVRGEFDAAQTVCLGVLKHYPNLAAAHTLLGDIADDRGNLEDAERWYDLALDLDPESPGDRRKLEDVRERRRRTESDQTVEQIGLPPERKVNWFAIAMGSLAALSFVGAAVVGLNRTEPARRAPAVVSTPVQIPAEVATTTPPVRQTEAPATQPTPPPAQTPAPTGGVLEDDTALRSLAGRLPVGTSLLGASYDPRVKLLTLTFGLARAEDEPRRTAAEIGRAALEQNLEAQAVTLRAVRDGRLVYVADVVRTRYADTLAPTWQEENAATPDAFVNYVLSNEWTAPPIPVPEGSQRP